MFALLSGQNKAHSRNIKIKNLPENKRTSLIFAKILVKHRIEIAQNQQFPHKNIIICKLLQNVNVLKINT